MKLISILAAGLIATTSPLVFAHAEHGQPQYGGIYGEAGIFQLELVAKDKQFVLYVTDHGESVSTKGATGKLTVLGTDGKSEVALKPAGENQLIGKVGAKPAKGTKVVATVTLAGKKTATVRFVLE